MKRRLSVENFEFFRIKNADDDLLLISLINYLRYKECNKISNVILIGDNKKRENFISRLESLNENLEMKDIFNLKSSGFIHRLLDNYVLDLIEIKKYIKKNIILNFKNQETYEFPIDIVFLDELEVMSKLSNTLDNFIEEDKRKNNQLLLQNCVYLRSEIDFYQNIHSYYR